MDGTQILYDALLRLTQETELCRKYLDLSNDQGYKSYVDTANALIAARLALETVKGKGLVK